MALSAYFSGETEDSLTHLHSGRPFDWLERLRHRLISHCGSAVNTSWLAQQFACFGFAFMLAIVAHAVYH
ncbi:hypothetical protein ACTXT7_006500 [Hymenolepis weldensis]